MNEHERGICARVRDFRKGIRWSQAEFANQIGLTRDTIAGIEYFRTPLRYDIAWKIRDVFGVSLHWLVGQFFSPDSEDLDAWPSPDTLKPMALLSDVDTALWNDPGGKTHARTLHKLRPLHTAQRSTLISILKGELVEWMAQLPDEKVHEFASMLFTVGEEYLEKLPKESDSKISRRRGELVFDLMRMEISKRLLGKAADISHLTDAATSCHDDGVKSEWLKLKKRIQAATADAGAKSKLADFLRVDLTQLSKWLTDSDSSREPGADYTLRMQSWVNHPKRQK